MTDYLLIVGGIVGAAVAAIISEKIRFDQHRRRILALMVEELDK